MTLFRCRVPEREPESRKVKYLYGMITTKICDFAKRYNMFMMLARPRRVEDNPRIPTPHEQCRPQCLSFRSLLT